MLYVRAGIARLAVRALGSRLSERVALAAIRGRLRILAFHGIQDIERFSSHMLHLAHRYVPVSGAVVHAALLHRSSLPQKAVWVTFDDGYPEVVRQGRPVLDRLGIPATLFVCPAFVGTDRPYWWEVVDEAVRAGIVVPVEHGGYPASALKTVPDEQRREVVAELEQCLIEGTGRALRREQLSEEDLACWRASGHDIGNHTWDHPCLDRCSADEQRNQIVRADAWLSERGMNPLKMFAYPNGNWAQPAESTLRSLGYELGLLFDHRLARRGSPPQRVSRLRADASAPLPRFRSIVSGAHSTAFAIGQRARLMP